MMGPKRFSLKVFLLSFVIAEVVLVYIFPNYVLLRKPCKAPSHTKFHGVRDKLNDLTEEPHFKSLVCNHSDDDQIGKSSQGPVLPPDEPEPHYTVTYQRDIPSNYPDLFSTDSEGNCRASSCKWPKMPGATRELVESAPELFEKIPLHFHDSFKNPCWVRGDNELNCLPYFYVIGAYKSGTFEIWKKITAHPDVSTNAPKEPHFWGLRRFGSTFIPCHKKEILQTRNLTGGRDDSSLEWYLNLYKSLVVPEIINSSYITKEGIRYHPKIFGDASVTTLSALGRDWIKTHPYARDPPYTTVDLFRALQPNAKFILMIRNPTHRANSFFWYTNNYKKPDPLDRWHARATFYIQCFKKCIKEHSLRYCAYASDCPFDLIPSLQVSIYHVYIRDWMKAFTPDHFKVIRLEDWQADSVKVYRDLIKFLDLRELTADEENVILKKPPVNVNKRKHEETRPETFKVLNDFFRPFNLELAKLMGDKKFNYPDYNGKNETGP